MLCKIKEANQRHHMIRRSKCGPLIKCEMNIAPLCMECHTKLHFAPGGKELEEKLQIIFINKLELLLLKREFTRKEIKEILNINSKATDTLCKTMKSNKGMFSREEILKACGGGQFIIDEEGDKIK